MRKVSFSCLSWLTELCYWWGNPLTIPTLLFFQWVGLLLWKDFFYFIFLHHNHFQERVKMQWTNTKQHIVCSQTHLLAIRNKDIVMHFCIYLHLLLFSNSKAMSIFYIQSTYRASLLWPFQELMFFAFLQIIVLFQCLFFFVSFLYCSSIWEKKGAVPVDTYTTCPAGSAKLQCKIMHLIKIKFMKERIHGFILELHVFNSALFTSMVFKSSEHRV